MELRPTKGWAKVGKVSVRDVVDGTLQTFADEGLLQRLRADAASRATQGTLEIELTEKYPQFVYWLAMPFFAPVPWEADRFYAQPGMAERNLDELRSALKRYEDATKGTKG